MAFFEGNKMTGGYGDGPDIINSCTINVNKGEIVAILGPNGAGKSTAMKAMLGMITLKSGDIILNGKDISGLTPEDRVAQGIAFVPQTMNIFSELTVEENLEMGAFLRNDNINKTIEDVYKLFPILKDKKNQLAGELSGGQRQQVAVGRALMTKPSVLMLDEPTAGINPTLINGIIDRLIKVNQDFGITLLVIEHNMKVIMQLAEDIFCLAHGKMLANGSPNEIKNDKRVIDAYLGAQ